MQDKDRTLDPDRTLNPDRTLEPDRTLDPDRTFGAPGGAPARQPVSDLDPSTLPPGTVLAARYQIIQTLGIGGMGAVYKAFDQQLTRVVALKTILPELAATPTALKRFKQEVLLAQQIIHKNVVRIFDIGDDGGIRFITMDFIEGVDLKKVIVDRGKLPSAEAVAIIRQACQGLEAAHAAGVVHRDLKPQNIMVQGDGNIVVMDFGIAHSDQAQAVTKTGALVGTPEYMSPEQAQGENVDGRSDIFSLGLIFYEMLTGKLAFHGDTMLETLFKRTHQRAIPPAEIEHSVPKGANDIVVKCLEIGLEGRYQSMTEVLNDLETFDPSKKVGAAFHAKARLRKVAPYRNWAVGAALVLVLSIAGFLLRNRFVPAPVAAHAPVTVLVADFSNHTGDPIFDGTLEPGVKLALEGAGFITAYDRSQLRALGAQPSSGRLDETAARQIALGQGLGVVVSGSLERQGSGFMLRIKATQAVTGDTLWSSEDTASNKDQVLFAAGKLAGRVRSALGDDTSESAQQFALETFTAASLEVVHEYATAVQALSNGSHEDALRGFSKAVDIDQDFAMAYRGMAVASQNLRQYQDAEKYIKLALGHIDRMTERERYRTRASYYLMLGNHEKCVEEYGALISRFPSDSIAHNNLAFCATQLRDMPKAVEEVNQALAIFPKRPMFRLNIALYSSYGSDFQTGEREARALQELDPSYAKGFIALAFAQLGQGQLAQAAETYQKLEKVSKVGASNAASGLADLALYEGRFTDAIRILDQGANTDLANKYPDEAAAKFAALAYTRLLLDQKGLAVAAAEKALASSKTVKIRFLAGRVLAAAGQAARAQALAVDLASELQTEPQAYAKLIEGEGALESGDPRQAIKAFTEANSLADTWIGRFALGRAYLEAGAFIEADAEFDRCIKRRGEALSLFLDESPTYGYFPAVYYYLGRVREGMKTSGFAESYRTYLSIRGKPGEDPLLAEVRRRAGS
jgi:tetratricopeptide (TPR) repeat protein